MEKNKIKFVKKTKSMSKNLLKPCLKHNLTKVRTEKKKSEYGTTFPNYDMVNTEAGCGLYQT